LAHDSQLLQQCINTAGSPRTSVLQLLPPHQPNITPKLIKLRRSSTKSEDEKARKLASSKQHMLHLSKIGQ
jgi:hypothetical protein